LNKVGFFILENYAIFDSNQMQNVIPMKKTATLLFTSAFVILTMSSGILDDNGRAGATGSPSEKTCNQSGCHNSFTVNTGGGSISISSPTLTNWSYVPNQTYTISVTVSKSGLSLFGLGFEALDASGANAGTLTAGTGTVLKSATVLGKTRTNITHALNGGASAGSHVFTFTWKAPATDIGSITFYCAGNAANGNHTVSGDYIYTTSQVVTSPSTSGIADHKAFSDQLNIYPNPAADYLQIGNIESTTKMTVSIMDVKGAVVSRRQGLKTNDRIELNELNTGTYLLKVETAGKIAMKQFIKQ
jgi:hypothetical protein